MALEKILSAEEPAPPGAEAPRRYDTRGMEMTSFHPSASSSALRAERFPTGNPEELAEGGFCAACCGDDSDARTADGGAGDSTPGRDATLPPLDRADGLLTPEAQIIRRP